MAEVLMGVGGGGGGGGWKGFKDGVENRPDSL